MILQKQLLYQHKNLAYFVIGSGRPVVLLHGFGEDGNIWKHQLNAFSNNTLIVPHLPGSGSSESINDMSMAGLAAAVNTIIEKETNYTDKIILFGHSMGGYITLAFAEMYPERLAGFGLIHSSAYADSAEKREIRKKGIYFIKNNGAHSFLKTTIPNLYAPAAKEEQPEIIEQHIEDSKHFGDAALIKYYGSMMVRPDRTAVLKGSVVPVLFLLGRYDAAVPLHEGLAQSHMPRLSCVEILEQSGHMGMLEEVEKTTRILKSFISFVNDHH